MRAPVIDIDKARMGRPSQAQLEGLREFAREQRAELRVRRDEAAETVDAIAPHLMRLEMLARAAGSPTAMQSVTAIRAALATHARRWGVTPPRAA